MPKRSLRLLGLLLLVACATTGVTRLVHRDDGPPGLVVVVDGLEHERGALYLSLFGSAEGFPSDPEPALRRQELVVRSPSTTAVFEGIEPGRYAVAVLHDENDDGEMGTDFLGRPSEGWGVSRDARGGFGPPSFDDAAIDYEGGRVEITIQLEY